MWDHHTNGDELPKGGKPTNVVATTGRGKCSYNCTSITAQSKRSRQVSLAISFDEILEGGGGKFLPSEIGRNEIALSLSALIRKVKGEVEKDGTGRGVVVSLFLQNGEQFCERMIVLVGEVFELLGIKDSSCRLRGNFDIFQTTHVLWNGRWGTYQEWLREKFKLQQPSIFAWTN